MIILASASPRRKELLSLITDNFLVKPSDVDETIEKDLQIYKYPEYLATKKAKHIAKDCSKNDIVIGCDTGVFINDLMLGKPKDKEDAFKMLSLLSNNKHKVITGCCIIKNGTTISFSQETIVEFYKLTDEEINDYIKTNEPMDKAGAYGIQGKGSLFVKKIEGNYFNVVGLPVAKLNQKLKKLMDN